MKISDITHLDFYDSKENYNKKGIPWAEDLGYNLFYIGKNADLYTCPGWAKSIISRSDRCSVFDIPLNLLIDGKGVSQTAISNNGASFAKKLELEQQFYLKRLILLYQLHQDVSLWNYVNH